MGQNSFQRPTGMPRYVILLSKRRDGRSGGGDLGLWSS